MPTLDNKKENSTAYPLNALRTVALHAQGLAQRALKAEHLDDSQRLDVVYELTIGRPPTEVERARALEYIRELTRPDRADGEEAVASRAAWTSFCHILLASTPFRFLD